MIIYTLSFSEAKAKQSYFIPKTPVKVETKTVVVRTTYEIQSLYLRMEYHVIKIVAGENPV